MDMDIALLIYNKTFLLIQQYFIHIINAIFLGKNMIKYVLRSE